MVIVPDYQKLFQQSHQAILGDLARIELTARFYSNARALLVGLRETLQLHLGRQDESFFSRLRDAVSEDRQAVKLLEFLVFDLKEVKVAFLVFFDRYDGYPTPGEGKTFPKDFREFSAIVVRRLQAEEDYLFPLFKRLNDTAS